MDSLVGAINKSADIQLKLETKIQWGSKTRPWRGLMDRFRSVKDNFDALGPLLEGKNCKKYYLRIEKSQLDHTSEFLGQFTEFFDQLEAVKSPSIHQVFNFI